MVNEDCLTDKEKRFCDALLADPSRNASAVYRALYPRASTATSEVNASKMLSKTKVADYIAKKSAEVAHALGLTQERIVQEISRLAFSDIRNVVDSSGNFIPLQNLPADTAAAIASVKTTVNRDGSVTTEYKFWDKTRALEMAGKTQQMFTDKIALSGQIDVKNQTDEQLAELRKTLLEKIKMMQV